MIDEIQKCLSCTRPKCNNCLAMKYLGERPHGKKTKYDRERVGAYLRKYGGSTGSLARLAALENVSQTTTSRWKKKYYEGMEGRTQDAV